MYPSDVSDKEWEILEPKEMVASVAKDFPPWKTCMIIFLGGVIVANWKKYMIY